MSHATNVNESCDDTGVMQSVAECCSVLQCVAVCCNVLRCVAVCCSDATGAMQNVAE